MDFFWLIGGIALALIAAVGLFLFLPWRIVLARAPLPMLALAASYGVYSFASLFVPWWVAVIQASAFELTYVGLAVARDLSDDQRKRATNISIGAVATSIVYNTLAGLFYRQPDLLGWLDGWGWFVLALLHGAPLAWVAYLVADLLLHTAPAPTTAVEETQEGTQESLRQTARRLRDEGKSWAVIAATVGRSSSTVRGWLETGAEG